MSEPTKNSVLPRFVEAHRLAKQGRRLTGNISLDDLQRLPEIVEEIQPQLQVDLQFFLDQQGRKCIEGTINASLLLVCQRCLDNMDFPVEVEIDLRILRDEKQALTLLKGTEWLLVEDETMDLVALVEDEIILALPLIASHGMDECSPPEIEGTGKTAVLPIEGSSKSNPFDVLGALKTKH